MILEQEEEEEKNMLAYCQYLKVWTNDNLLFAYMTYTRAKLQGQTVTVFRTNAAIRPLQDRPVVNDPKLRDMVEEHCTFLQNAFGGSVPPSDHATWTVKTQQDVSNYAHRQRTGNSSLIQITGTDLHSPNAYIDPPLPEKEENNLKQFEAFFKAHKSRVETELFVISSTCMSPMLPIDAEKKVHAEKQLLETTAKSVENQKENHHPHHTIEHQYAALDTFLRCLGERSIELQRPCRADILHRALCQHFPDTAERNKIWHLTETALAIVQDVLHTQPLKTHRHVQLVADLLCRRVESAGSNATEKQKAYLTVIASFMALLGYCLRG